MADIPPRIIMTPYTIILVPGDRPHAGRGLFRETMDYATAVLRRKAALWGSRVRDARWGAPGPVLASGRLQSIFVQSSARRG